MLLALLVLAAKCFALCSKGGISMSRVAKNPVKLPAGVEIKMSGQQLSVKGAKGALELNVHPSVEVIQESGELRFAGRNGDQ